MIDQVAGEFCHWPLGDGVVHWADSESEFSWIKAKEFAVRVVFTNTGKYLSDIEMKVLQGSWEGKTYDELAKIYGYSAEYLNKDVGNKLWSKLSEALGQKVSKKNFKEALLRAGEEQRNTFSNKNELLPASPSATEVPFPEGSEALDSPFYIEHCGIKSLCYETILKPGSLIRIKAPKLMGKTSLMTRILAHAANQNYQTVYLDLSSVDRAILTNLDKFLRWLCLMVGRQLRLKNQLNDYWDTEILGSNDNCTVYFEEYLLAEIDCPVILGLDQVDRVFAYTEVIEDFLGMLRSWHEKGKISQRWKQLRLVMAHSTEVYIPLDMNQSPFNAGVPVELLEFDVKQIQDLAHLHDLNWNHSQVEELTRMVGGHPYLVRLAMYYVSSLKVTLEQLLQEAPTEAGIYSNHLRRHLETLQKSPELALALKQVVTSSEPIELDSMQIYKLHSMGLVQRQNNYVTPRYNLYREYFRRVLV
ncbi:AAA-like domain-containing protein [Cylindrospermum sp. FACHB-282]|uniref:AAA-like domain-containing protein n=1 Tax=Cylindrospermum sp. FACHB-282 TaxID=2692794 RepID=UPI00168A27DF|nr:AAA-like domain-containing protein [Cylindrospermum sp. FACHB-282]MBD2385948.1 AAA-like domain-containing protein [Cylindrospermum sp. FACHB-282]